MFLHRAHADLEVRRDISAAVALDPVHVKISRAFWTQLVQHRRYFCQALRGRQFLLRRGAQVDQRQIVDRFVGVQVAVLLAMHVDREIEHGAAEKALRFCTLLVLAIHVRPEERLLNQVVGIVTGAPLPAAAESTAADEMHCLKAFHAAKMHGNRRFDQHIRVAEDFRRAAHPNHPRRPVALAESVPPHELLFLIRT